MKKFKEYHDKKLEEANFKSVAAGLMGAALLNSPATAATNWNSPDHKQSVSSLDDEMHSKMASKEETMQKYGINPQDWEAMNADERMILMISAKLGEDHPIVKKLERKAELRKKYGSQGQHWF